MASWFRLDLGDPMLVEAELERLCEQAQVRWESDGSPSGWAVYSRLESGGLHCRLQLYFTPAAGEFARNLGARSCAPPHSTDLQRCAGVD